MKTKLQIAIEEVQEENLEVCEDNPTTDAEMQSVNAGFQDCTVAMDDASALNKIANIIDNVEMNNNNAELINTAVESITRRYNFKSCRNLSVESYKLNTAKESISEIAKNIWEAIKKFLQSIVDWVKKVYNWIFGNKKQKDKQWEEDKKEHNEAIDELIKNNNNKTIKTPKSETTDGVDESIKKFKDRTKDKRAKSVLEDIINNQNNSNNIIEMNFNKYCQLTEHPRDKNEAEDKKFHPLNIKSFIKSTLSVADYYRSHCDRFLYACEIIANDFDYIQIDKETNKLWLSAKGSISPLLELNKIPYSLHGTIYHGKCVTIESGFDENRINLSYMLEHFKLELLADPFFVPNIRKYTTINNKEATTYCNLNFSNEYKEIDTICKDYNETLKNVEKISVLLNNKISKMFKNNITDTVKEQASKYVIKVLGKITSFSTSNIKELIKIQEQNRALQLFISQQLLLKIN